MIKNKKFQFVTSLLVAVFFIAMNYSEKANAATYPLSVTVNWIESTCTGSVNGQGQIYEYDVAQGDDVSITVTNSYSSSMTIENSSTYTSIAPGASYSATVNVSSQLVMLGAEPDITSCGGMQLPGIFLYGAVGSLVCDFYNGDNTKWGVYGELNSLSGNAFGIFDSNTLVNTASGSIGGYLFTGSASVTPRTFYMRVGSSSTGRLIAQSTCPAMVVSQPTETRQSTPSSTPTLGSSTSNTTGTTKISTQHTPNKVSEKQNSTDPTVGQDQVATQSSQQDLQAGKQNEIVSNSVNDNSGNDKEIASRTSSLVMPVFGGITILIIALAALVHFGHVPFLAKAFTKINRLKIVNK